MSRLVLKASEFADLTASFLLDKLMNPDDVIGPEYNEDFNVLMESMNRKGMRAFLMKYYMNMGSGKRIQYKRIKDVFRVDKKKGPSTIVIEPDEKKKGKGITGLITKIKDKVKDAFT